MAQRGQNGRWGWDGLDDIVDIVDIGTSEPDTEDIVDIINLDDAFQNDGIIPPPTVNFAPKSVTGETSTVSGVPIIYGRRKFNGINVFKEMVEGDGEGIWGLHVWYLVFVISEGETHGLEGVWLEDSYVDTYPGSSGVSSFIYGSGSKGGYSISWNSNNGTHDSSISSFGNSTWGTIEGLAWDGTKNKLKGISNVRVTYRYSGDLDTKDTTLPKITFDVRGKMVNDIYDNLSTPGQRYNPSTSGTPHQYGTNPALCLLDYLTNTIYGAGISTGEIDLSSFRSAQYYCDEEPESGTSRHSCNLILDPNDTIIKNVKLILATCNGSLMWLSGKYFLKIDRVFSSTDYFYRVNFDKTKIVGGISIVGETKQNKANHVTASYIEPNNNWGMATVSWPDRNADASTYTQFLTTEDNGVPLKRNITLDGVTNYNQARYLAQQACLRSRNNLKVSFRATAEAMDLIPSDIITITHDTPAWSAKEFIVRSIGINADGTVKITCSEYQESTYTWNNATAPAIVADTNLPDPTTVSVPAGLAFTESVYESIASGGKKVRVTLSWTDNTDYYNSGYDFQFKKSADSSWTDGGTTVSTSGVLNDFEKGTFDFRVRAKNSVGSVSSWVTITSQVTSGVIPIPPDVVNFDVNILNGSANLTWDLPNDADIQSGGYLEIRNLQEGSSSWDDAVFLARANPTSTNILLPLVEGNYVARWIGSDGNTESINFAEKGLGTVYWTNTIATFNEHPAWNGTMTGLYVADNDGDKVLKFESAGYIDDFTTNFEDWGTFDEQGGVETDGEYLGLTGHDLGAVFQTRVYTNKVFTSGVSDGSNYIDAWTGKIDSRTMWDETRNLSGITTYISTTEDDPASANPTWTAWKSFLIADIKARGFKIKIKFESESSSEQFKMTELATLIDMPSRVMGASAAATTTITYADPFYAPPNLVVTPTNLGNGEYYTISSETKTGFGINFFDSADSAITRNYNYLAKGY